MKFQQPFRMEWKTTFDIIFLYVLIISLLKWQLNNAAANVRRNQKVLKIRMYKDSERPTNTKSHIKVVILVHFSFKMNQTTWIMST